jgi:hypothetical protein
MKKVILFLFGLMFTSVAFSQSEGYLPIFEQPSLIETKDWTISDNRCFKANDEIYVLAYEPFVKNLSENIRDKDLYLYRKTDNGWEKASSVIRHDYFHWQDGFPVSLQALDIHVRRNDKQCYGTINVDPDNGNIIIELKTLVWKKGESEIRDELNVLTLTRNYDKTYNIMSLTTK